MVLKRSSVLLLIGMIILSIVLPSLQAMAKEGEKSDDTSQASEEIEDSAEEVEVKVVGKTEPIETTEPEKTVVDEKVDILVSNQWINVPESENPPSVKLYLVNKQTGEQVKSVTLGNVETSYLFGGLDKYDGDGALIEYAVKSGEVKGYETSVKNYTVTHSYIVLEKEEEISLGDDKVVGIDDSARKTAVNTATIASCPGDTYEFDDSSVVVPIEIEKSTNDHTRSRIIWTNGNIVYAAINSTHKLKSMVLNGKSSMGMDQYNPTTKIYVNCIEYDPKVGIQGNTDDAHWTVFKFDLLELGLGDSEVYKFSVTSVQGGGHDIKEGNLLFKIPKKDVKGKKTWVGGTERPAITLMLMRQGKEFKSAIVNGTESPTAWAHTWTDVPVSDAYGRKYEYTVDEKTVPVNYVKLVELIGNEWIVTNTYTPTLFNIEVEKKWIGPAAGSVTIKLFADDIDTGKMLDLNDANEWRASFSNLKEFHHITGEKINYRVEEVAIAGYSTLKTMTEKGFIFTNTNDEKISVDVVKEWDGRKTSSVTIKLLANDEDTSQTLLLNENNGWKGSFSDLRKYDAISGEEIRYSVVEQNVPDGYAVSYSPLVNGKIIVTNTEVVGSLKVLKVNESGEVLEGATFELWVKDGDHVGTKTTNSSGEIDFEGLAWGEYQLIETNAPNGYRKLLQPIEITIGPGDLLHIEKTVVNTLSGWIIPKTGGIGAAGFYGFGALLMVLTLGFFLRRRKPNE
ncbi:Cna B-type domain-containing protein [Sporosarcina jiandibaonis]|uniref:Cna B-type domain-containing protein n=1 Tax=Sporosarcina jiandibaonis TaxID=2715535 RepID=UPI0015564D90|nr:Cna B-type domain-containing protein [Sporosarcina jiandibaonis]